VGSDEEGGSKRDEGVEETLAASDQQEYAMLTCAGDSRTATTLGTALGPTGGRREKNMRITLNVVGVVLVAFGSIWFLQGINVLPGSFMTGQIRWAIYGGIAVAAGGSLLLIAKRRQRPR